MATEQPQDEVLPGSLSIDDGVAAEIQRLEEEAAERELERATPEERSERLQSATAYEALSAGEAQALVEQTFPTIINRPTWKALPLAGDEEIKKYLGENQALVGEEGVPIVPSSPPVNGEQPVDASIVMSTLPLRAPESGSQRPIDPDLVREGDHYEAANATVEAEIPVDLEDGISLPDAEVQLRPEGAEEADPADAIGRDKVFYSDVAPDTDFLATPTQLGVETFFQLRSKRSPEVQAMGLELPFGSELESAFDGLGAAVVEGDELVATVSPPMAFDADGVAVPVELKIVGSDVELTIEHRSAGLKYPILVDPVYQSYAWQQNSSYPCPTAGQSTGYNWHWQTSNTNRFTSNCSTWRALWSVSAANVNYQNPNTYAQWTWQPPPKTYIQKVSFGPQNFYRDPSDANGAVSIEGVYRPNVGWEAGSPGIFPNSYSGQTHEFAGATDDNTAVVQLLLPSAGYRGSAKWTLTSAAAMEVADRHPPTFSGNAPADKPWMNQPSSTEYQQLLEADDEGVGMKYIWLVVPGGGVTNPTITGPYNGLKDRECSGVDSDYPPTCLSPTRAMSHNFKYKLNQGYNLINGYAIDQAGTFGAAPVSWRQPIDRSAPIVESSGGTLKTAGTIQRASTYTVTATATDGSLLNEADMRSGVTKLEAFVDNDPTALLTKTEACTDPRGSCSLSAPPSWTVQGKQFSAGTHTIRFVATDALSQESQPSQSFQFTVAAPDTTITSGPSGPTKNPSPVFGFAADDGGTTFQCRLDGPGSTTGTVTSCSNPKSYSNLADGSYEFRVAATDQAGVPESSPATRTFRVDTQAPVTTLNSGPTGPTKNVSPSFGFSTNEASSSFECRLLTLDENGAPDTPVPTFSSCTSPRAFQNLAEDSYRLEVRATDQAGNVENPPASRAFRVDTTKPDTTITSGPGALTNDSTPTFEFTSSESPSTFTCRLKKPTGPDDVSSCTSPFTPSALPDGTYTLEIEAEDAAGNVEQTPASRTFRVDATPPETTISSDPGALTSDSTPTFEFTSSESPSTFTCRLKKTTGPDDVSGCTSPFTTSSLPDGTYTLEIEAEDEAGNVEQAPASRAFTVDTAPPETTITSGPGELTGNQTPEFAFESSEAGSSFKCRVFTQGNTGGALVSCSSPFTTQELTTGLYTFEVRGTDQAGNEDPSAATYSFEVDPTLPETEVTDGPGASSIDPTPTFSFISDKQQATFQCRLDSGEWEACTSPKTYALVPLGEHTFYVRAIDRIGRIDPSPAEYDFGRVEPATTEAGKLGLEQWFQYDSVDTGLAGAHTNLGTGNLVWQSVPTVNPGRGMSSVLNLTYNSYDYPALGDIPLDSRFLSLDYDEAGLGYSIALSGVTRINEPLGGVLIPNLKGAPVGSVTMTDPDGTTHAFAPDTSNPSDSSSCGAGLPTRYVSPPGVNLELRRFACPDTSANRLIQIIQETLSATAGEVPLTAEDFLKLDLSRDRPEIWPTEDGEALTLADILDIANLQDEEGNGEPFADLYALEQDDLWAITRPDGITYYYNGFGFPTKTVDRDGNELRYVYEKVNPLGERCDLGLAPNTEIPIIPGLCEPRLVKMIDAAGVELIEASAPQAQIEKRTITIEYNELSDFDDWTGSNPPGSAGSLGDLVSYVLGGAGGTAADLNSLNKISAITDHAQRRLELAYTGSGQLASMTEAAGTARARTTTFTYDQPPTPTPIRSLSRSALPSSAPSRRRPQSSSSLMGLPLASQGSRGRAGVR